MIEKEKPDAVYAIMAPHLLYDVAATAIEMGCNLFIEKPPAVTTEQIRQLALLARKHKVLTGVTFQRRFSPVIRRGKELCEKRGAIHTAHASFYKNWVGADPYYRGAMDMLTCDGIHAVDTLRYLCGGEVDSIASDSRRLDAGHWNIHLALVKFTSGATGVLLVNFMAGRRFFTVEAHAPGISFLGDPEEGGRVYADNQLEPVEVLDPFALSRSRESHRAFGAYDTNLHFVECVRRGRQPETSFDDAVKTMELVEAVYWAQI
jgi:predicted dehydrogenase